MNIDGMGRAAGMMRPNMGRPPSPDQLIEKLDADGDGALNADEARGPLAKRFERMDGNGDGKVSREELERSFAAVQAKLAERMAEADSSFPGNLMRPISPEREASIMELLSDPDGESGGDSLSLSA
ncbi:MAG: hypothetical protein HQL53_00090 [Magnetococcales bacterium]|nr:hypothetical protein [Magnetococcales bacterium]